MSKNLQGLLIGALAALVIWPLSQTKMLKAWEDSTWDWRVRTFHSPTPSTPRVKVIYIDQPSIDWVEKNAGMSWIWMREIYAPIMSFCKDGGALSFAFDLTFTQTSKYGQEDDQSLGNGLSTILPTALAVMGSRSESGVEVWPDNYDHTRYPLIENAALHPALKMSHVAFPVPQLLTNAAWIGSVAAAVDETASIRRTPVVTEFQGKLIPSLGLAAWLAGHPGAEFSLRGHTLYYGTNSLALQKNDLSLLRFPGPPSVFEPIPASAVLQSFAQKEAGQQTTLDPAVFKDCIVLIGASASDLKDIKPTPLDKYTPGVIIHAMLLENLLAGSNMRNAPAALSLALILGLSLIGGTLSRRAAHAWQNILLMAVFIPMPLIVSIPAYHSGYWLPVMPAALAVTMAVVGGVTANYAFEGRQKRFLKRAFSHYMNPDWVDKLIEQPDRLQLGGEERVLSIYFSDVQGFTTISESLTPSELTALLNEYLTAMTDIIQNSGGVIDKYEGDAIIAFWNAPIDIDQHAQKAVEAALECQSCLNAMRADLASRYGKELYARAGINTGRVVVGNMGSHQHFNYTFLGDAGNLAARLEGINKQFGTFLMISEFTLAGCPDSLRVRELGNVTVVGKAEPVRIYEPFSEDDYLAKEATLKIFAEALTHFYAGEFKTALEGFEAIAGSDRPAASYVKRCKEYIDSPPDDWNGYFAITEK
jgi:adenylate cyclase